MQPEERGTEFRVEPQPPAWQRALVTSAWRTSLLSGVVTVVLGVVVALQPSGSLSVIAVLLGILLVISGLVHLVRALDRRQEHRGWLGIAGLLLIVFGVVLIRHIDLTIAVIGMLIGVAWIVQGLAWLMSGLQARTVRGHGWQVFFGAISLIAGIVVTAMPVSSVTALASLVGICFAVLGTAEIIGALIYSRPSSRARVTAAGRADTPSFR
ncbi:MAG TPA: DUF308 domain-containing protein [Trebonia sp.]|jgi:uncharacterized membrane protein HdeD (DUF308 family)